VAVALADGMRPRISILVLRGIDPARQQRRRQLPAEGTCRKPLVAEEPRARGDNVAEGRPCLLKQQSRSLSSATARCAR